MRRTPIARYTGKLASGKRVYVAAYDATPLAFAVFVTRKSGRVELVGKTSVGQHEETLRFNPETRCYERKPDNSMHVLTARESADEYAGWWSRHGTDITLVEVLELTVVRPRK